MTTAASKQMNANRNGTFRSRRRKRSAPAPSSTITERIASSSFPIPKKRAPKPGLGPASERTISGEPDGQVDGVREEDGRSGHGGRARPADEQVREHRERERPRGEHRGLDRAARVEGARDQGDARQPHAGQQAEPQPLPGAADEHEHGQGEQPEGEARLQRQPAARLHVREAVDERLHVPGVASGPSPSPSPGCPRARRARARR